MRVPSNSPITIPFGSTDSPYSTASPHLGTDFAYEPDNTIYAPCAAKVLLVPNNGRDGNGIYLYDAAGRFHGLLHTSKYLVDSKSMVAEGQAIAVMGDTGYAFGVHLHWCVKENGAFIDPMTLVKGDNMTREDVIVAYMLAFDCDESGVNYDFVNAYTNHSPDEVLTSLITDKSYIAYKKQIASGSSSATTLKPGLYKVA